MFSLNDIIEENIGKSLSREKREMIQKDLKSIKVLYRRERGFWKSLKVNYKSIMFGFKMYEIETTRPNQTGIDIWNQFVSCFRECGADFLDLYML